jgi:hypothetical protein
MNSFTFNCIVCGKHKGKGANHSSCVDAARGMAKKKKARKVLRNADITYIVKSTG